MYNFKRFFKHLIRQPYLMLAVTLCSGYSYFQNFQGTLKNTWVLTIFTVIIIIFIILAIVQTHQDLGLEKKQKESVERLGHFWIKAVNTLFARRISDDDDFTNWLDQYEQWKNNVNNHLKNNFSEVEASLFMHLGSIPSILYEHRYNNEHNHQLELLGTHMERLKDIMSRHSTLLFLKGITIG